VKESVYASEEKKDTSPGFRYKEKKKGVAKWVGGGPTAEPEIKRGGKKKTACQRPKRGIEHEGRRKDLAELQQKCTEKGERGKLRVLLQGGERGEGDE